MVDYASRSPPRPLWTARSVSLDLKPVQVRLPDDAKRALKMLADAHGHDQGEEAREILTEALLGKAHAIRVLAEQLVRAVKNDNTR